MILCIVSAVIAIIGLFIGALELMFEADCLSRNQPVVFQTQDCTNMKVVLLIDQKYFSFIQHGFFDFLYIAIVKPTGCIV